MGQLYLLHEHTDFMTFVVFVLQSQNFDIQVNHKTVRLNSHFVQT